MIKAQQEGAIENARYKEFKDEFASLINDVFNEAKAQLEMLHGRREIDKRDDISDAIVYDRPTNLHEIGSAYKKFTKLTKWIDDNTDPSPILFGLTNLLDEVYVFHVANKELKEIITATVRKKRNLIQIKANSSHAHAVLDRSDYRTRNRILSLTTALLVTGMASPLQAVKVHGMSRLRKAVKVLWLT